MGYDLRHRIDVNMRITLGRSDVRVPQSFADQVEARAVRGGC